MSFLGNDRAVFLLFVIYSLILFFEDYSEEKQGEKETLRIMIYNKEDAIMTRGFAILCMVVLHLFCRTGTDVYGTPLIWINPEIPFVYLFGFYAEICVSVYSICMGYAQYRLYRNGRITLQNTGKRILRLMVNYWIILVMFSIAGLVYSSQKTIPGSITSFLKSIVLLHSYNGAWWFLNTYIIFLLIPVTLKFFPVKKISTLKGFIICVVIQISWYLFNKLGFWPHISGEYSILSFIWKELYNLISVLPAAYLGAFLCKGNVVERMFNRLTVKFPNRHTRKIILWCIWILIFISMNIVHKAALNLVFAGLSFLLFNLWEKGVLAKKVWLFLGKHSTNIWLTHMFFYLYLFSGFVQKAQYPVVMLGLILILCVVVSYIEMWIERVLYSRLLNKVCVL